MDNNNSKETDILFHHKPKGFGDWIAFALVRTSRIIADAFFAKRYGPRAVVLETVAAVPGAVGAFFLHLKCLRHIRNDHGWIRKLHEEAENERMHLMIFALLSKPSFPERLLIIIAQGIFCFGYALVYLISPKTGHRVVGYLEEEAVKSYTHFLEEIESGRHENPQAPGLAIVYWKLSPDACLREIIIATREDEIRHRNSNHSLADRINTLSK